ncbi:DEAD/DEAH box helicase family protein [Actinomycetospora sp. CA-084318]|uniref:DEAD/DEAH box helicase family protein n=1 Tax=Actinomycetospora sp. CA-084318 TaxID=3239892 RepID=UPI003D96899E
MTPHPIPSSSYLEEAFVRWVLTPATTDSIIPRIEPQAAVERDGRSYRIDYVIHGAAMQVAVELDGFQFHSSKKAFSYDRVRQNDLSALGYTILRYSYESVRLDTARCVQQLQAVLRNDPLLRRSLVLNPDVIAPDMITSPLQAAAPPSSSAPSTDTFFATARALLDRRTLRPCQDDALTSLVNYFTNGGRKAACVMSVGAGKTALGVAASFAGAHRRALFVTPGSVIRGTFDAALDPHNSRNVLYALPSGPMIPGCRPPRVAVLDADEGPIRHVTRERLLASDIIVTNFHSLGTGQDPQDLLAKLEPQDVDFIVVDEAHIAAAESYQRLFARFPNARCLLMSACFTRLDGKPIDADVVYRYRLIDSVDDGHAKNLRVHRFDPDAARTVYEIAWPDGRREEVVGREAVLRVLHDERRLARITVRSTESVHRLMSIVRRCLDAQEDLLYPVKPRVLFATLGEKHAEQISQIASEHGIPCASLHHSMTTATIRRVMDRFERDSGDLKAIAQLKMLGQGYDFPPITIVVPMRPYGSFGEFYQFVGRGVRTINHPALTGRVTPEQQYLDLVFHAELGLDPHLDRIRDENDMDPIVLATDDAATTSQDTVEDPDASTYGLSGVDTVSHPDALVLLECGRTNQHIVYDEDRVEARREEREREALAQRYAEYAASTASPATFEQFVAVIRSARG